MEEEVVEEEEEEEEEGTTRMIKNIEFRGRQLVSICVCLQQSSNIKHQISNIKHQT